MVSSASSRRFLAIESVAGLLVAVALVAALSISNSPWSGHYEALRQVEGELRIGQGRMALSLPLVQWVNDLWMGLFFLVLGIEIKRQFLTGELGESRQALLPVGAAIGGMLAPAAIYAAINLDDPVALRGWAAPVATDLVLVLGLLWLLGTRVPPSLKVFVTAVAILDNLAAGVASAFVGAASMSLPTLAASVGAGAVLVALNRLRVTSLLPYLVTGALASLCLLQSGVHASLAGVATAFAIPMYDVEGRSPIDDAGRALHPWVVWLVLPLFAFLNAGVAWQSIVPAGAAPVSLGVAAALVLGKPMGVFGASWLIARLASTELPADANRWQFFGICLLCGVGTTTSLFVGGLAFEGHAASHFAALKVGVFAGSLVAAVLGTLILLRAERRSSSRRLKLHSRFSEP